MTTGFLGRITEFKPKFFYKIEKNIFKIVPENSKDSTPCLIDTGFDGFLILPAEQKEKFSVKFLQHAKFYLANGMEINVELGWYHFRYHSIFDNVFVAFADIPEAIMGMQLISWFEKVTFDSVNSDVLYKRR